MAWDARFAERDARFAPIARAARAFAECAEWPAVQTWNERLAGIGCAVPVRFVAQSAPLRRNGMGRAPYDLEIVERGRVPSRERSWHDFLNMLVWAVFPRTKLAIHTRQLEASAREDAGVPRGRERDALSMLDEGSVLVAAERVVIFGHALYEHLVVGHPSALHVGALELPVAADASLETIDQAAAAQVADLRLLRDPAMLARRPFCDGHVGKRTSTSG